MLVNPGLPHPFSVGLAPLIIHDSFVEQKKKSEKVLFNAARIPRGEMPKLS